MLKKMPVALFVLLAACAAPETKTNAPAAKAGPETRLPGKISWTDGKGDVPVIPAGKARCEAPADHEVALILASTNKARAARGLKPLAVDERLQRAAQKHSCDQAERGMMTHIGHDTTGPSPRVKREGYSPRITAENIGAGRMDAGRIASEWVKSPGHIANIVVPDLTGFGLGKAYGSDGRTLFWTAVYAAGK